MTDKLFALFIKHQKEIIWFWIVVLFFGWMCVDLRNQAISYRYEQMKAEQKNIADVVVFQGEQLARLSMLISDHIEESSYIHDFQPGRVLRWFNSL